MLKQELAGLQQAYSVKHIAGITDQIPEMGDEKHPEPKLTLVVT